MHVQTRLSKYYYEAMPSLLDYVAEAGSNFLSMHDLVVNLFVIFQFEWISHQVVYPFLPHLTYIASLLRLQYINSSDTHHYIVYEQAQPQTGHKIEIYMVHATSGSCKAGDDL